MAVNAHICSNCGKPTSERQGQPVYGGNPPDGRPMELTHLFCGRDCAREVMGTIAPEVGIEPIEPR